MSDFWHSFPAPAVALSAHARHGPRHDASWIAIKHDKAEVVDGKKGKEWRVTFKDVAAKDKSKETLYMFFTSSGNFIAANFAGQ